MLIQPLNSQPLVTRQLLYTCSSGAQDSTYVLRTMVYFKWQKNEQLFALCVKRMVKQTLGVATKDLIIAMNNSAQL